MQPKTATSSAVLLFLLHLLALPPHKRGHRGSKEQVWDSWLHVYTSPHNQTTKTHRSRIQLHLNKPTEADLKEISNQKNEVGDPFKNALKEKNNSHLTLCVQLFSLSESASEQEFSSQCTPCKTVCKETVHGTDMNLFTIPVWLDWNQTDILR